jgi:hypothetical protein
MATALTKISAKKKKTAFVSSGRKSITLEERHVGVEVVNWLQVEDMNKAVYETLRHYNYFYDLKDGVKWVAMWMKKHMTKEDLSNYQEAETWRTSMTAAGLCKMHINGAPFDADRIAWIKNKLQEAIVAGSLNKKKTVITTPTRMSPSDIIKQRTSDFIAEIEEVIDIWDEGVWLDVENYSVYNELKKIDASSNVAKAIIEYYTPFKDELNELLQKKTPDLVEGYQHLTLPKKKELLKLITLIIDDAEQFMTSKKAVRKTRVAKPKSATQQVSKVLYLKESVEYKITSVDPMNIIGASELYLFNVKYRTLAHVVTQSSSGFTLKGTTLQGIDATNTSKKMLRKPDEALKELMSMTKAKSLKFFSEIKTSPSEFTGRINNETIILKVYK